MIPGRIEVQSLKAELLPSKGERIVNESGTNPLRHVIPIPKFLPFALRGASGLETKPIALMSGLLLESWSCNAGHAIHFAIIV
jgi:hypothetical protein